MKDANEGGCKSNTRAYYNDIRQLELLKTQYSLETINILTNVLYIKAIRMAIDNLKSKYSGEDTVQYNPDSITIHTALSSVIARIFSISIAIKSYRIAESRRENGENDYPLDANIMLVNATVIGLLASLLILDVSKTFYSRTVTGIPVRS